MSGWESVCVIGFFVLVGFHLLPWMVEQLRKSLRLMNSLDKEALEKEERELYDLRRR